MSGGRVDGKEDGVDDNSQNEDDMKDKETINIIFKQIDGVGDDVFILLLADDEHVTVCSMFLIVDTIFVVIFHSWRLAS